MEVLQAVYQRRAVREFSGVAVSGGAVLDLLRAAAQAPSAMNRQPWAFAVFHGRQRLAGYSRRAKTHLLATAGPSLGLDPSVDHVTNVAADLFHGADTLVVICAKPGRFSPTEDCFLAAENLMLAAHDRGLATCPIGCTRPWFNLPEVKAELGIPADYDVALPIVIGHPARPTPHVPKNDAEITCWCWDD